MKVIVPHCGERVRLATSPRTVEVHNEYRVFANGDCADALLQPWMVWQCSGARVDEVRCIPLLDAKLRVATERLAQEQGAIADAVYRAILASNAAYAGLAGPLAAEVHSNIRRTVAIWFKTLLTGNGPNEDDTRTVAASGRQRAQQGLPLSSVLAAVRVGSQALWRSTLAGLADDADLRDGLLYTVSPYLLEHFDAVAQTMSSAYLDEQYRRTRGQEALRRELLGLVLGAPGDTAAFQRVCEALGIDPTIPRVALVMGVGLPDVFPSRTDALLGQVVLGIARQLKMASDELVYMMHRDKLVVWVPTHRGDSVLSTERHLLGLAQGIVRSVPEVTSVGVGLSNAGASGWADSADEAFKALDAGMRSGGDGVVYPYSEIAVTDGVLRAPNVLRYLNALLERLSLEPELLTTLTTYFDQAQHRRLTAAALGIHPNTLNYRLDRVESMLGARLDEAGWIARLDVAMRLFRHSHIPPG
ncbi:helix-turn-helix domain-containing protein [Luteibacter aegosomaticola]|uniref:PucR family transcriptional regulator n=1 Tax=Luteibacter aegosomaticola TaxID=2911538 RepID=UPI001FFB8ABB|nr:helix-turn-helix domain-containing protein [Luteibacter aegosomaticola]UPG88191.1 helix-turn-helix domain-containing protein [Luteibacter aegosomaticola]